MAQNTMVKKGRCLNFGNCNKANTKEIIEVNLGEEFECPECHGELVEVKTSKPPYALIGGGIVVALAIAAGAFFFLTKEEVKVEPEPINLVVETTLEENENEFVEEQEASIVQEEEVVTETPKTTTPTNGGIITKDLGYAVWTGKVKNGKPHDVQGTLTFKKSHIIDSRDDKGRTAGPGDKVIGTFENGHLTQGRWYKADGNVESIILGGL